MFLGWAVSADQSSRLFLTQVLIFKTTMEVYQLSATQGNTEPGGITYNMSYIYVFITRRARYRVQIYIGYYTGSRSVRLDIFTSLTYFVESAGRDKIQRQIYMHQSNICVCECECVCIRAYVRTSVRLYVFSDQPHLNTTS